VPGFAEASSSSDTFVSDLPEASTEVNPSLEGEAFMVFCRLYKQTRENETRRSISANIMYRFFFMASSHPG